MKKLKLTMNKYIKRLVAVAAITVMGTASVPASAVEIATGTIQPITYRIPDQKTGDLKLLINNKIKYLFADNYSKKADILEQVNFLVRRNNPYLSIDVTNFNIIASTIDKKGVATGNFVISDKRDNNSQIILPFTILIQCLDTDEEKALTEKATKIVNSMNINKKTDYKEVQAAVIEGLADDSINVEVSDVYNRSIDGVIGDYRVYVYLYNENKTIDTECCVKGYIYPTLNGNYTLSNIVYYANQSLYNIYDKDLNQESIQNIVNKLLTGTSVTAKVSDYVQIPVTDTTYGEVLFSITYTDSRDTSTVTKYFDTITGEPKTPNNNQAFIDYSFGITMIIANYKATNSTTLSNIESAISGTIQCEDFRKCIESYSFRPATTSIDGSIDFTIRLTGYNKHDSCSVNGYTIRIPRLTS